MCTFQPGIIFFTGWGSERVNNEGVHILLLVVVVKQKQQQCYAFLFFVKKQQQCYAIRFQMRTMSVLVSPSRVTSEREPTSVCLYLCQHHE